MLQSVDTLPDCLYILEVRGACQCRPHYFHCPHVSVLRTFPFLRCGDQSRRCLRMGDSFYRLQGKDPLTGISSAVNTFPGHTDLAKSLLSALLES